MINFTFLVTEVLAHFKRVFLWDFDCKAKISLKRNLNFENENEFFSNSYVAKPLQHDFSSICSPFTQNVCPPGFL